MMGRRLVLSYVVCSKDGDDRPWHVELRRWHGHQRVEELLTF
jgi:hypothetical protein